MYNHACACDATLDNISLGGACIKVMDGVPNSLHVGKEFNLMVFHKNNTNYSEHACKVVRRDSISMGVSFLHAMTH
jgi:c-di-GMP-binding flagellar brake protein YcgR